MKQKNGNALKAFVAMSLIVATQESCLNSQAEPKVYPFNQRGKVIRVTDTSIAVKTEDTTFILHPMETTLVKIGDSAKFHSENNLPGETTAIVDTLCITKKDLKRTSKKK